MIKILHNNLIIDLCSSERYLKYSLEQERFIAVKRYCANAVLGSDGNTVYHLEGTPYTFPNQIKTVRTVEIDEFEYDRISSQLMLEKTEAEESEEIRIEQEKDIQSNISKEELLDLLLSDEDFDFGSENKNSDQEEVADQVERVDRKIITEENGQIEEDESAQVEDELDKLLKEMDELLNDDEAEE